MLIFVSLQACVSIPARNPLPEALGSDAQVLGIPKARYWGDETPFYNNEWFATPDAEIKKRYAAIYGKEHHYLAISGGGANGAFGAGLLLGWSALGTRPQFTMVTGVSTGALTAPFAFLGSSYDTQLKEIYTQYSTKDLVTPRNKLTWLSADSISDTAPLRALIAKYINDEVIADIATEHRKGRVLKIGTTNLDAKRPVTWNIGSIAASKHPKAKELIHDIMLASASIPVIFPPVLIETEVKGQRFDEIHVDGGVTSQVFLYPLGVDWRRVEEKLAVKGTPQIYMIRNSKIDSPWNTVKRKMAPIAGQTIVSLIRTQGIGDMYRIYLGAKRDGLDYNLAYIPRDFVEESTEMFDPVYMNKLFERGYALANSGNPWNSSPPGVDKYGLESSSSRW